MDGITWVTMWESTIYAFATLGAIVSVMAVAFAIADTVNTIRAWRDAWYRERTRTLVGRS